MSPRMFVRLLAGLFTLCSLSGTSIAAGFENCLPAENLEAGFLRRFERLFRADVACEGETCHIVVMAQGVTLFDAKLTNPKLCLQEFTAEPDSNENCGSIVNSANLSIIGENEDSILLGFDYSERPDFDPKRCLNEEYGEFELDENGRSPGWVYKYLDGVRVTVMTFPK